MTMHRRGFLGRLIGGVGAATIPVAAKAAELTPGKRATFRAEGQTWQWDETQKTWITAVRLAPSHNVGSYRPLGADTLPCDDGPTIRQVTLSEWLEMRATDRIYYS
jgi:hypothetical protein